MTLLRPLTDDDLERARKRSKTIVARFKDGVGIASIGKSAKLRVAAVALVLTEAGIDHGWEPGGERKAEPETLEAFLLRSLEDAGPDDEVAQRVIGRRLRVLRAASERAKRRRR